jgi:OmpA-OmpF porin, OOP family
MRRAITCLFLASVFVAFSGPAFQAEAQVLQRLKQRAQQAVENAVNCAVGDTACIEKAKRDGKEVVVTDSRGVPLSAEEQEAARVADSPAQARPGEGAWANYDFVPGERILFREDFASDRVGNFPRRLEFLNGDGEVVTWNNGRWLRSSDWIAFAVPLPEVLPERFTIEFQVTLPWWGMIVYGGPDGTPGAGATSSPSHTFIRLDCCATGITNASDQGGRSVMDPRGRFKLGAEGIDGMLFDVRVQADGRYMKLYLNDVRIANFPNANFLRGNKLYFEIHPSRENPVMLGNLSVNAGGQTMYDALVADGRFVTQGILFDVDSDRLRPESTPTLSEIVEMLKAHPALHLRVEGHTDATGQAAHNVALSQRRAASVKAYLVQQGVSASRLESEGHGPNRPVASNDTPEGRQSNRRVELVRLDR